MWHRGVLLLSVWSSLIFCIYFLRMGLLQCTLPRSRCVCAQQNIWSRKSFSNTLNSPLPLSRSFQYHFQWMFHTGGILETWKCCKDSAVSFSSVLAQQGTHMESWSHTSRGSPFPAGTNPSRSKNLTLDREQVHQRYKKTGKNTYSKQHSVPKGKSSLIVKQEGFMIWCQKLFNWSWTRMQRCPQHKMGGN